MKRKYRGVCVECDNPFKGVFPSQKYCSSKCRKKHHIDIRRGRGSLSRFIIFQRDDFRCIYCGKSSIEDGIKLELDHIVPKYHDGEESWLNLVTSCRDCNGSKGRFVNKSTIKRVKLVVESRIERIFGG